MATILNQVVVTASAELITGGRLFGNAELDSSADFADWMIENGENCSLTRVNPPPNRRDIIRNMEPRLEEELLLQVAAGTDPLTPWPLCRNQMKGQVNRRQVVQKEPTAMAGSYLQFWFAWQHGYCFDRRDITN